MAVSCEFEPVSKQKTMEKLGKQTIKQPLAEAVKKITLWLDRTIKVSTPVDTGRLRSSITSEITAETGKVGTNVEYAGFVEYGTKRMEARHVSEGSSTRIKGKGPFTYSMEQLNSKMGDFLKELGDAIKVRFA